MEYNFLAILFHLDFSVKYFILSFISLELNIDKITPDNGSLNGGTIIKILGSGFFMSNDHQCKMILPDGRSYPVIHFFYVILFG